MKKLFSKIHLKLKKYSFSNFAVYLENYFLKKIILKIKMKVVFEDKLGIRIYKHSTDDFKYLIKSGNLCDASPLMEALSNKFTNLNVAIDVGANIGVTSIWMSNFSKKVICFEPEKQNFQRLKENILLNNAKNIYAYNEALSNKKGLSLIFLIQLKFK